MNIEFKKIPLKIASEQNAIIVGVHLQCVQKIWSD